MTPRGDGRVSKVVDLWHCEGRENKTGFMRGIARSVNRAKRDSFVTPLPEKEEGLSKAIRTQQRVF